MSGWNNEGMARRSEFVNHVVEIVQKKNYAPNNTLILIWDFGVPISVVALLVSIGTF